MKISELIESTMAEAKYKVGFKWDTFEGVKAILKIEQDPSRGTVYFISKPIGRGEQILFGVDNLEDAIEWDAKVFKSKSKTAALAADAEAERLKNFDHEFDAFISSLSPMAAGKARKALEKPKNLSGKSAYLKDHIKRLVKEGWRIGSTKTHGEIFEGPRGNFHILKDITKLGMDYVKFLTKP